MWVCARFQEARSLVIDGMNGQCVIMQEIASYSAFHRKEGGKGIPKEWGKDCFKCDQCMTD